MNAGDDGPDAMKGIVFQHFQAREKGVPLNLIQLLLHHLLILYPTQQYTQNTEDRQRMGFRKE